MNKVRKQHYVPQFYLKQWCKEKSDKQLYAYDKERKKSFSSNIEDIASSNYFYDLDNINEQYVKKFFSEIEDLNSRYLTSIIKRLDDVKTLPLKFFLKYLFIKHEEMCELSVFIAYRVKTIFVNPSH